MSQLIFMFADLSTTNFDPLNFTLNVLGLVAVLGVAFMIYRQYQLARKIELVLAPKFGIEAYLAMCGQVIENDPDGLCVVGDDGSIQLVNKAFEDISGFHRTELVGQQMEMVVPPASRNTHRSHREEFIANPSSRGMRGLVLQHKRGKEVPVGIRLNRYLDTSGGHSIAKVRVSESELIGRSFSSRCCPLLRWR